MRDDIIVKLPFQFVAGGKTLPAGTYKVSHLTNGNSGRLILTSRDNGTSVFVLPYLRESTSADNPQVSFRRVGEEHFLSAIQTTLETYYIEMNPGFAFAHNQLAQAYLEKQMFREAIAELQQGYSVGRR